MNDGNSLLYKYIGVINKFIIVLFVCFLEIWNKMMIIFSVLEIRSVIMVKVMKGIWVSKILKRF